MTIIVPVRPQLSKNERLKFSEPKAHFDGSSERAHDHAGAGRMASRLPALLDIPVRFLTRTAVQVSCPKGAASKGAPDGRPFPDGRQSLTSPWRDLCDRSEQTPNSAANGSGLQQGYPPLVSLTREELPVMQTTLPLAPEFEPPGP